MPGFPALKVNVRLCPGRIEVLSTVDDGRDTSPRIQTVESVSSFVTLATIVVPSGMRMSGPGMLAVAGGVFFRTYLLKQGFRDGVPGLIISLSTAYSVFLKYAKVWEQEHVDYPEERKIACALSSNIPPSL